MPERTLGVGVSPGSVLRVRAETDPAAWRPFRWATYLLTAEALPITVAGALRFGGGYGRALLVIVTMGYLIAIFGVEFTIRMGRKPQVFEFDSRGIRVTLAAWTARQFTWNELSTVRVRTGGPRGSPTIAALQFRAGLRMWAMGVDLIHSRDVAERVLGVVIRHAPRIRRMGNVDAFRWDATSEEDGDLVMRAPTMEPLGYVGLALSGTAFAVWLTASAWLIGVAQDRLAFWAMVAAYLVLGMALVSLSARTVSSIQKDREPAQHDARVRVILAAAVVFLLVEGALGIVLPGV